MESHDLSRLTLRFKDKNLEQAYGVVRAQEALRPTREAIAFAIALAFLFVLPYGIWVESATTQNGNPKILILFLNMAALGGIFLLSYAKFFLRHHQAIMALSAIGMTFALSIGMSHSNTRVEAGFFLLTMHFIIVYGVLRLGFPNAVVVGWTSIIIHVVIMRDIGDLAAGQLFRHSAALVFANLCCMLVGYQLDLSYRRNFLGTLRDAAAARKIAEEHARADALLLNILPPSLAKELTSTGVAKPVRHEAATILFTDFSGFSQSAASIPAEVIVAELNEIFSAFDDICVTCGIEKIKTIGDAYMAAGGIPDQCADHAQRCVMAGIEMISFISKRNESSAFKWQLRVGIHSGPVIAGVVGKNKYAFDVWGDTVNIASRMEGAGEIGRINLSAFTYALIRSQYDCEYRGRIDVKGKGPLDMYFVVGPKKFGQQADI